jgi:hypothetical protein
MFEIIFRACVKQYFPSVLLANMDNDGNHWSSNIPFGGDNLQSSPGIPRG